MSEREEGQDAAIKYFQATTDYFWRWAEGLDVVEWQDGNTIGYREELLGMLKSLLTNGLALPQLGSVLLLLAGCSSWSDAAGERLWQQRRQYSGFLDDTLLTRNIDYTIKLLQQVAALPAELRTGVPKQHLFREVFAERTSRSIEPVQALSMVDEWASGRLDVALQGIGPSSHWSKLISDLIPLGNAGRRFEVPGSLELHLRTGLDQLPEPLPLPEPPAPEILAPPLDLMAQLAQDPRTAGLARLTQHLVAALRIPMHLQGASDQPLGGVSDVTNRGNFDRLLLSELAHDDLSLMARLVNNEALYLRREEPPRQDVRPRIILLDTTLRMWGVPRVFALAAALAWARNSRQTRPPAPVAAVALGGEQFSPLDLETFEGVVAALELLDVALHGGVALQAFARLSQTQAPADSLLITDAQLLHQPEFALALAEAKTALRFLLTVDRSGELQLYEYQNGHRVPLSAARYDLEELLFAAPPRQSRRPAQYNANSPAFLQCDPAPLYLPVTGLFMSIRNTFQVPEIGVLAINDVRRVLFWTDRNLGARELLPVIEEGNYWFGSDGQTQFYVLVSGPGRLLAYLFAPYNLEAGQVDMTQEVTSIDLSGELEAGEDIVRAAFINQRFYVQRKSRNVAVFDWQQRRLTDHHSNIFPANTHPVFRPDFGHLKRHVNNGYNVLLRISRLEVNGLSELVIQGHELRLISYAATLNHGLQLMTVASDRNAVRRVQATGAGTATLTPNEQVRFHRFTWPDGSETVVDPRGLLHLRSADASIPEITLLLIMGKPTAAWAADGTVCGPDYFTGRNPAQRVSAPEFYQQYLQRFIAHLA
ncbi:hypothetical protein [Hymenobacter negativus]|uniref:Uncharacterized protein n=1 Tax=Hymenobacter negativus TaxID=2795026 RepID=A0ABS3QH13_9BACT|nr:hypothetical protein [Hymenobacter negativus]MBO2010278.1 hypothetical protein [Hymenobacter negativus]